jgi:hypothetical protein
LIVHVVDLNGEPPFDELRVSGGFGLIGGHLSSEPVEFEIPRLTAAAREGHSSESDGSNTLALTYETHPLDPGPPPFQDPFLQKAIAPGPFSVSLSNKNALELRH